MAGFVRVRRLKADAEQPILKRSTPRIDSLESQEEPGMEQDSKSAYNADAKVHDAHWEHREHLMDEALMDTFPASDPIPQMCFD
ncbi:hypothetical protein G3N95_06410 [Paraburkholderia sp. Tr-20389]|uniref:hypothetical protein n=1 Tax=Paraburkholderia sp. Tr-20389 TaxID=2703903 RepID=UPI00197CF334|nr:hypothetical protein [Paraburkholderia sp. Tr-20389]MBN3752566.1 hypothetical protein [Paraburkholderia sp. Tr-20389]